MSWPFIAFAVGVSYHLIYWTLMDSCPIGNHTTFPYLYIISKILRMISQHVYTLACNNLKKKFILFKYIVLVTNIMCKGFICYRFSYMLCPKQMANREANNWTSIREFGMLFFFTSYLDVDLNIYSTLISADTNTWFSMFLFKTKIKQYLLCYNTKIKSMKKYSNRQTKTFLIQLILVSVHLWHLVVGELVSCWQSYHIFVLWYWSQDTMHTEFLRFYRSLYSNLVVEHRILHVSDLILMG